MCCQALTKQQQQQTDGDGGWQGEAHTCSFSSSSSLRSPAIYRLVGLVVKASASRAEGPGFESRLRRDFFGVESYQ